MPRISRLAGADDAVCKDWLTKCVVGGVGICCFAGLCARFVRIGSQTGWVGSGDLLFLWCVYPLCENSLTQWVV